MYSNCCCSCLFEGDIIKIAQPSHNYILNFQESMTILNASTKKSGSLLNVPLKFIKYYERNNFFYVGLAYILLWLT